MRMDIGNRAQIMIDMRVTQAKSETVEEHYDKLMKYAL